ncbi:uncharacterized protein LOC119007428 isoform X1 [Acanthopagrus latus]|uniref:uncharacterized protein LOC119007428 isoform X1 n=2 Tax=Acanthopagrus latus TaxID=8177 RepID=UPI00187BF821|nr:uncharacterized protein LOC119007428 isoform X1 [Acanthopagrus latus]XP_036932993.1 uncharacterized protein LOC119007428 isoform X1 [Acanthopagrus latus]XP_036932994.1 uncharacterized protein LOC119007428 isoform X1 [Acanthopagrus latus]XP_036932995.1 uncharacterized protein LOC119007428 isoform X1 [Acanthopagrus latus]
MLLLLVTASCAVIGSSAGVRNEEICYGSYMSFPTRYVPVLFRGQLYFTPNDGGPRKLLMDNGESKDPRLIFPRGRGLLLQDLRDSDSGTYSGFDERTKNEDNIMALRVLDCSEKKTKTFGETYTLDVSRRAEYLEFTPLHTSQTTVLWSRSNSEASEGGRGGMTSRGWEIVCLSPADRGHYNFRKKDNSLLSRIRLSVQESFKDYHAYVNGRLLIEDSCFEGVLWTVTFSMMGAQESEMLIKAGRVLNNEWISPSFKMRIWVLNNGIDLNPVRDTDAGTYTFSDPQGNLAHVATLVVYPESGYVYAAIAGGIVLAVIICCCCVRKCCCKKASKRDESAPVAVYYHDPDQPAYTSSTAPPAPDYSHQPVNSPAYSQPAATSVGPSDQPAGPGYPAAPPPAYSYQPVNPSQPEVSAPGGPGATPAPSLGSDYLTSDPDTTFELKGLTLPSAPPLGSDSEMCYGIQDFQPCILHLYIPWTGVLHSE